MKDVVLEATSQVSLIELQQPLHRHLRYCREAAQLPSRLQELSEAERETVGRALGRRGRVETWWKGHILKEPTSDYALFSKLSKI